MLKKLGWAAAVLLVSALAWWYYPSDFGTQRPPKLPPAVPIVEGEIVKSHEEIFATGKGYIIETRVPARFEDVSTDYQKQFARLGYQITVTNSGSAGEEMVTYVAQQHDHTVMVEIVWKDKLTYVTTAVHMHKWILL